MSSYHDRAGHRSTSPPNDQAPLSHERPPPPGHVRTELIDRAARKLLRAIGGRVIGENHEAALAREHVSIIAATFGHRASFGEMMIGRAAVLLSDYGRGSTALPREFTSTEDYLRVKIIEVLPELLDDISICPSHPRGHA
jgi:hypothetical protein